MSTVTIRAAKEEDAEQLLNVHNTSWLTTYVNEQAGITLEDVIAQNSTRSVEKWKEWLAPNPHKRIWVALVEDQVVGFCIASQKEDRGNINSIYLLEEHQRIGIGKQLIEHALTWIDQNLPIYVDAVDYNEGAINFYMIHGFEHHGPSEPHRMPTGKILNGKTLKRSPKK